MGLPTYALIDGLFPSPVLGLDDGTRPEGTGPFRVLGALRVKGGPCGRDRLRATFRVSGGIDCEPGEVCADVAYNPTVRLEERRGC